MLIDIHGGPEAQYRAGWNPFVQFLVNELGYAVIAPNVRGSSGYGKTFLKLDNGVLREDAVKDIGSLMVWIGVQPMFDREHVAVMGGSYGGYMALATLVLTAIAFRAASTSSASATSSRSWTTRRRIGRTCGGGIWRRARSEDARVP